MTQVSTFPQISTRGRYDLRSGEWLGKKTSYTLYPKRKFIKIEKADEIVIFVHGMRNSKYGARRGGLTLRQTLRKLGYKKHPVVSFSYDADIIGAHIPSNYKKVLGTAYYIAHVNGIIHLSNYIVRLKKHNPNIKIHLVGHSLGCIVIGSSVKLFSNNKPVGFINSVHLFGSPLEYDKVKYISKFTKITNYYNPTDDVIIEGVDMGDLQLPTCLVKKIPNVKTILCLAKDHRFRSYMKELHQFP